VDLQTNHNAPMTRWAAASGALKSRMTLVDVGVQGGPQERWLALGDALEVHGFDALPAAIAALKPGAHHHYYAMALGARRGTATLHVAPDPCGSSLYDHSDGRPKLEIEVETLDHLFEAGILPPADFIKLDCEGYEPEVLKGAAKYLEASCLLGAEVETSFNTSVVLRQTHFWGTYEHLIGHGLLLFDLDFDRYKRPSFPGANTMARPSTFEILFARDFTNERYDPSAYAKPFAKFSPEAVLKSAIMFEVYGMTDVAYDILLKFRDELGGTLDVDHALALLVESGPS